VGWGAERTAQFGTQRQVSTVVNLTDGRHVGAVIVNDGHRLFFGPSGGASFWSV
jgi:hypothetical protein